MQPNQPMTISAIRRRARQAREAQRSGLLPTYGGQIPSILDDLDGDRRG